MTGWCIGYATARFDLIKGIIKIQSQTTSCANSMENLEKAMGRMEYAPAKLHEGKVPQKQSLPPSQNHPRAFARGWNLYGIFEVSSPRITGQRSAA